MLKFQWADRVPDHARAQVVEMLAAAARYDHEMGFSRIDPGDLDDLGAAGEDAHYLLVWIHRDDDPSNEHDQVLAAFGRLAVSGSERTGVAQFVVTPEFRSRGLATMVLERFGSRIPADGWGPTGARTLEWWAYGDHPAAERLAARFGLDVVNRTWKMRRHLTGPFAADLPSLTHQIASDLNLIAGTPQEWDDEIGEVLAAGGANSADLAELRDRLGSGVAKRVLLARTDGVPVGFVITDAAVSRDERHPIGYVHAVARSNGTDSAKLTRVLLAGGLQYLSAQGAAVAELHIDPTDEIAVTVCRQLAFEQDQADVRYAIPTPKVAP